MATWTQVEGRVLLHMVMIKQLQMLIWWMKDQQKHGLALNPQWGKLWCGHAPGIWDSWRACDATGQKKNHQLPIWESLIPRILIHLKMHSFTSWHSPLGRWKSLFVLYCASRPNTPAGWIWNKRRRKDVPGVANHEDPSNLTNIRSIKNLKPAWWLAWLGVDWVSQHGWGWQGCLFGLGGALWWCTATIAKLKL